VKKRGCGEGSRSLEALRGGEEMDCSGREGTLVP